MWSSWFLVLENTIEPIFELTAGQIWTICRVFRMLSVRRVMANFDSLNATFCLSGCLSVKVGGDGLHLAEYGRELRTQPVRPGLILCGGNANLVQWL